MKWMVDLNVVLDVLQQREPFYSASALTPEELLAAPGTV